MSYDILPVAEFNKQEEEKWREACRNWHPPAGFPCRAMYLFLNEKTGEPETVGFVASTGYSHSFRKTKKEAEDAARRF